jgi:hypothetical protein
LRGLTRIEAQIVIAPERALSPASLSSASRSNAKLVSQSLCIFFIAQGDQPP